MVLEAKTRWMERALAANQAIATIAAKHADWRKCMPADWEGDPLSDAIDAAAIRAQWDAS